MGGANPVANALGQGGEEWWHPAGRSSASSPEFARSGAGRRHPLAVWAVLHLQYLPPQGARPARPARTRSVEAVVPVGGEGAAQSSGFSAGDLSIEPDPSLNVIVARGAAQGTRAGRATGGADRRASASGFDRSRDRRDHRHRGRKLRACNWASRCCGGNPGRASARPHFLPTAFPSRKF